MKRISFLLLVIGFLAVPASLSAQVPKPKILQKSTQVARPKATAPQKKRVVPRATATTAKPKATAPEKMRVVPRATATTAKPKATAPEKMREAASGIVSREVSRHTKEEIVGKDELMKEASYQGNWIQFLQSHVRYPAIAIDQETQGDVILEFVVELDGSISQVKVKKSLSKECDDEAIRVVKLARWEPAVDKNGNKVRSLHYQKITFRIY